MTEFDQTNWAKAGFARQYREKADIYIVERRRMLEIMKSYYRHFPGCTGQNHILDLGCGDGIITDNLLEIDDSISATLIDGSGDMLNNAKERLKGYKDIRYIQASFQDILEKDIFREKFNFIVSSLAIHHLAMDEKRRLFEKIYSYLDTEGYFMNIDVILAPAETLEQWYLTLWREWMDEKKTAAGIEMDDDDVVRRFQDNKDNKPDTLNDQLNALRNAGFKDVDCFYKYGVFTVYGGKRQG